VAAMADDDCNGRWMAATADGWLQRPMDSRWLIALIVGDKCVCGRWMIAASR
jgi:hypothetical protein